MLHAPVDPDVLDATRADGGWLWLHFSLTDARGCTFIAQMDLPARAKAALLERDEHSNLHLEADTAFGVFVDWHYEFGANASCAASLGHLRFALAEGLVVSARLHPLRSVESIRRRIDEGVRLESAGRVLEAILEQFAATIAQTSVEMTETLDRIEDRVLDEARSDERRDLGQLRRQAVQLHRPLTALRRVLKQFEQRHRHHSSHALLAVAARLSQRVDDLDSDVVSIMTSLFLTPTLIVGIFGMNTGGLPLTQTPTGSGIAIGLCLAASAVARYLLRRVGVLR